MDHALLDRKTLHSPSAEDRQGLPTLTFRYYVDLDRRLSLEQEGVFADQATLARLLEDAEVPLRRPDLIAALHDDPDRAPSPGDIALLDRRLDFAMRAMRRLKWIRSVGQGAEATWVWNGHDLTDEEWVDRFRRRDEFGTPIGRVRLSPPEAFVTIIQPREE